MDNLEQIFTLQSRLQSQLFGRPVPTLKGPENLPAWQGYVNQQLLALVEETVEVMRETAYKNPAAVPWGWKKGQTAYVSKMREELADLLHFFVNLCLAAGLTAETLTAAYLAKHDENVKRKEGGY